jgi:hypothetical protein
MRLNLQKFGAVTTVRRLSTTPVTSKDTSGIMGCCFKGKITSVKVTIVKNYRFLLQLKKFNNN